MPRTSPGLHRQHSTAPASANPYSVLAHVSQYVCLATVHHSSRGIKCKKYPLPQHSTLTPHPFLTQPAPTCRYDSYNYIQHISYAITAAVQKDKRWVGALDFASREFATALGLPDLYAYDGTGLDISAGGGQMVSCRDVARVGQLVLNRGTWLDEAGSPYQLGQPAFYDAMLEPAFPGIIDGYGFLTWLNTDMTKKTPDGKDRSHCCGPRWGGNVTTCAADGVCGTCCAPTGSYNLSRVPCDPDLTVL